MLHHPPPVYHAHGLPQTRWWRIMYLPEGLYLSISLYSTSLDSISSDSCVHKDQLRVHLWILLSTKTIVFVVFVDHTKSPKTCTRLLKSL